jgi:hypothetical protein
MIDDKGHQSGSPLLFIHVVSQTMCVIESKPLAIIRNTYCYLGKALQIVIMYRDACYLTRSQDHALKADRSLYDPIVKLKAICLGI